MALVLDSSVCLSWFFPDERTAFTDAALDVVANEESRRVCEAEAGAGGRAGRVPEGAGRLVRAIRADVVPLCPPLIIAPAEIDELFDRLGRALDRTLDWAKKEKLL